MIASEHARDLDCTVDPVTDCCVECGVYHGSICPECGGSGFHSDACPSLSPVWIIQRHTQQSRFDPTLPGAACWILEYEDFPTPEGRMTRAQMIEVLDRVCLENPNDEFRGHRLFDR